MNRIWTLFYTFFKIGALSIGGGYAIIPLIQEQVVERAGWVSEKVFTDIITISQMTPGPLAVNTSTFVGLQIAGVPGAVAATVGCVLCGVALSLVLYAFFRRYRRSVYVFEVLGGLKAASLGLIMSAAGTILLLAFFGTGRPRARRDARLGRAGGVRRLPFRPAQVEAEPCPADGGHRRAGLVPLLTEISGPSAFAH